MNLLLVVLGAAVGAPLRYLTDRAVARRHDSLFPWGTFVVNLAGCLVLGFLSAAGTGTSAPVMAALGTGLCGALTTYSTFGYETVRLVQAGAPGYAVVNVAASLGAGLLAAGAGVLLSWLVFG